MGAVNSDPASNEMFLMTSDRNNDINIQKWTNSSWSSTSEVETSYNSNYECFDIAFNYQKVLGVTSFHGASGIQA